MNYIKKSKKSIAAITVYSLLLVALDVSAIELISPTTRVILQQVVQEINDYQRGIGPRFPTTVFSTEERLAQLEPIFDQIIDDALPKIQAMAPLEVKAAENYRQILILWMQQKQADNSLLEQENAESDLVALENHLVELNAAINYFEELWGLDR